RPSDTAWGSLGHTLVERRPEHRPAEHTPEHRLAERKLVERKPAEPVSWALAVAGAARSAWSGKPARRHGPNCSPCWRRALCALALPAACCNSSAPAAAGQSASAREPAARPAYRPQNPWGWP